MNRTFCLFVLLVIFVSCGGEIETTDISKVAVIVFDVHPGNSAGDTLILKEDIDIVQTEFEEFLGNLESVQVNRMEIQVTNLLPQNTPRLAEIALGVDRNLVDSANVFSLDLRNLPTFVDLPVTNSLFEIVNTDRILIYERNTGRGIVTEENEGIRIVSSLIENFEPMQLGLGLLFLDILDREFNIEISFDLTAKVRLN